MPKVWSARDKIAPAAAGGFEVRQNIAGVNIANISCGTPGIAKKRQVCGWDGGFDDRIQPHRRVDSTGPCQKRCQSTSRLAAPSPGFCSTLAFHGRASDRNPRAVATTPRLRTNSCCNTAANAWRVKSSAVGADATGDHDEIALRAGSLQCPLETTFGHPATVTCPTTVTPIAESCWLIQAEFCVDALTERHLVAAGNNDCVHVDRLNARQRK